MPLFRDPLLIIIRASEHTDSQPVENLSHDYYSYLDSLCSRALGRGEEDNLIGCDVGGVAPIFLIPVWCVFGPVITIRPVILKSIKQFHLFPKLHPLDSDHPNCHTHNPRFLQAWVLCILRMSCGFRNCDALYASGRLS